MESPHRFSDRLRHPLVRFFAVMLACYVLWFAVYEMWLGPDGRLDEWLSLQVAAWTAGLLNLVGFETLIEERHLWMDGYAGVLVVDGCNGLSSLGLFIAFVVAFPGSWRTRLWFVPLGAVLIYVVNVARIGGLLLVQVNAPALFVPAHQIGMTVIFYATIFCLWAIWAQLGDGAALRGETSPALAT